MSVNPHWQNGFECDVFGDRVSGKWWFRITLASELLEFSFESEVVYSTREDAESAANDAATAACDYQAHCVGIES